MAYTHWRLLIYNQVVAGAMTLAEWKFYGAGSVLIPTTTGTPSASDSTYNPASNMFDGNINTWWGGNLFPTYAAPQWVKYQFTAPVDVVTFSISCRNDVSWSQAPSSFALQGSNDGTTWTTLGMYGANFTGAGQTFTFTVGTGLGDWYRLLLLTTDGSTGAYAIAELVLKDAGGTALPLNGGAIASSVTNLTPEAPPVRAFDGSASTFWASQNLLGTQFLSYRFSGSVTVGSFSITARTGVPNQTPHTFTLQKSTDGGTVWSDVQSYTAETWTAGAIQTFTVGPPPPGHRYWRLLIYNNAGTADLTLASWRFYNSSSALIPTTGGTASASDSSWGAAANAFDGNDGTFWGAGGSPSVASPHWIRYDFAAPVDPASFTLTCRSGVARQAPSSFSLQASDNGSTWTTISNHSYPWDSIATMSFPVGGVGLGDAYRIKIYSNDGDSGTFSIAEVVFKDSGGSPISLANGAARASTVFPEPGCGPATAFDGVTGTHWASAGITSGQWLAYFFAGSATVTSFSIQARAFFHTQSPHAFDLEKSTDGGVNWVLVQSFTAATWTSGAVQTFPPVPPASIAIAPTSGVQGATVSLAVTGTSTHFSGATTVTIDGTGITVGAVSVTSATALTVPLTIALSATVGPRTITVTTGAELNTAAFSVSLYIPPIPPPGDSPVALTINSIHRQSYVLAGRQKTMEWTKSLQQTGTARWQMGGHDGDWVPLVGQAFGIYDTSVPGWGDPWQLGLIFAGSIDSVTPLRPSGIVTDWLEMEVTGSSREQTLQRRLVRPFGYGYRYSRYKEMRAGDIAQALLTDFADGENLVINSANFDLGPTIPFVAWNHQSVAEAMTQLADYAEMHWWIAPDSSVYFKAREAVFAPWGIVDGDNKCQRLSVRETRENLNNAVYYRTSFGAFSEDPLPEFKNPSETVIVTTPGQTFFQTEMQIQEAIDIAIEVPGESGLAPSTIAQGDGTDSQFWYIAGDDGFSLTTGSAPLPLGAQITLHYNRLGGDVIPFEDATAISERAAVELVGSGRYELAVSNTAYTSREAAEQRASMILQQRRNTAMVIDGETMKKGLDVGQALVVSCSNPPINDTFLITSVSARAVFGTPKISFSFTGVNGNKLPNGWDFFTGLGDSGFGGGFGAGFQGAGMAGGAGGIGGGGGAMLADLWREVPVGTIDGANAVFYLTHVPMPTWSLELKLNQSTQNPKSNAVQAGPIAEYLYTLEENKITYRFAPQPGDVHDASYWRGKPAYAGATYTYRYWRLLIFNNSGGQIASLAEWNLYDVTGAIIPTTGAVALGNDDYYPASNAFDGNPATQWATSPGSNPRPADPDWLRYQYGIPVSPATFTITANNTTEFYYAPDSFALQGSDDGTAWTTIGNYTGGPWSAASETRGYTVAAVGMGDFYRVYLLTTASLDHYSIPSLIFMNEDGDALSLVNGQAMAGGTYISNNCGPSRAFDGNNATFWRSFGVNPINPHWLGYRFAGPVTVGSFSIRTRDSIFYGEAPLTFRLEKSTDGGGTWTVIQSYTTPAWTTPSEVRTFTVD